ncbi:MAG: SurA N-terminal domain-containing protein [Armatimonadetes bacterium]|nr:SurA N-terminal domain-containing protein [Armatimonadota bacterium]
MNKTLLVCLAGVATFTAVFTGIGCGNRSGGSGGTLATVNGEAITLDQFRKYLETKSTVTIVTGNGQIGNAKVSQTLGFQALQDLIQQRLLLQMAKDRSMEPTDKDIEAEIEFQKKLNPNFFKELSAAGLTVDDIRTRVKVDLARERLVTEGVKISTEEATKYWKDHPSEFLNPATASALVIFVKAESGKKQVDSELANGQAFADVAKRRSELPRAKQNPRYPQNVLERMPGPIRAALEKTDVARQTDWIQLTDGFAKFYVEEKTPAKPIPMDETQLERLRRQLAMQRGLKRTDLDTTLLNKYKQAKISIKYDPLQEPYKEFEDDLKKTDLTTDSTGAAAGQ